MDSIFKPLVTIPEPNQARSREALDRFLAAGEALLAINCYEEAGVAEIAKKAESSVGTFYRLLGDKETLSLLLLQRFMGKMEARLKDAFVVKQWQGKGVEEIARTFVSLFVTTYSGRRGVLRALILRASRDTNFRDRVHQLNDYIAEQTAKLLRERLREIDHPKPEKAITAVVHIVLGALNQHTVTGNLGGLSEQELTEELTRVFTAYLGVKS